MISCYFFLKRLSSFSMLPQTSVWIKKKKRQSTEHAEHKDSGFIPASERRLPHFCIALIPHQIFCSVLMKNKYEADSSTFIFIKVILLCFCLLVHYCLVACNLKVFSGIIDLQKYRMLLLVLC